MKITFVTPYAGLSGGIRVVAIYADRLQKRGHEVFVVSRARKPPTLTRQLKSILKGKGWISPPKSQFSFFDNLDVTHKVVKDFSPMTDADVPDADVVVATFWLTAEWVANLPASKGAKAYFIQHHETHEYLPKDTVKATYYLPLHKITIANWLVKIMENQYGDSNVSLVLNSVDTNQFYAEPRKKQVEPTVGLMYSPAYWKGCDVSLKAFSLAREKRPNLSLVAFGKKETLPQLPIPPNTTFIQNPPQSEIREIYAQCDAWLFGSRQEGFGLPILEAMACRTPVIGTPAGAAPELLPDGGGILVKPEDPEEMAKAIIQICQMSEREWQGRSQAAYATATSYTWDDATDLFEKALYTAIERTKKGEL